MRILIDVGHPGHVHFFKHAIWELQKRGHTVFVTARDKDVTVALLRYYQFPFRTLTVAGNGFLGQLKEFLAREIALSSLIRHFDPHVVTEITGDYIAPVCWLLRKPSVVWLDSEPVPTSRFLTYPFARVIYTPNCFLRELGNHQIRYAGYHELAYLHPAYFQPDPTVLEELGVDKGEPFTVLRFVAWNAGHDIAQRGFSHSFKIHLVKTLSQYGRVFITSEKPLTEEFEPYRITIAPHRIHHALYYASLFIGDGATMATEAALLGTPAVRASSMALNMGNFRELMDRYQLVYSYYEPEKAMEKAEGLLKCSSKSLWAQRRDKLLSDTVDVTKLIVETLENLGSQSEI